MCPTMTKNVCLVCFVWLSEKASMHQKYTETIASQNQSVKWSKCNWYLQLTNSVVSRNEHSVVDYVDQSIDIVVSTLMLSTM